MNKHTKIIVALVIIAGILLSTLIYGVFTKSHKTDFFNNELGFLALDIMTKSFVIMNNNSKTVERPDSLYFVNTMQDLQLAFQEKYVVVKLKAESLGIKVAPTQIYNLLAKELDAYKKETLKSSDFLNEEEAEKVLCMKFDFDDAMKNFGINLSEINVKDKNGKLIEPNYYLTKNGDVFVWPPYEIDNEFYLNSYEKVIDLEGEVINKENASKMFKDDFILQIDGLEISVGEYLK